MLTRRAFLGAGTTGAVALTAFTNESLTRVAAAAARVADRSPSDVAGDETYWREIQQGFTLDRTLINLNNGGCCPSPRVVHEAFKRYLDLSNAARGPRGVQPCPGLVERGARVSHVADPRAEHRDGAAAPGRRVRLRSRGNGDQPPPQRGAASRAVR